MHLTRHGKRQIKKKKLTLTCSFWVCIVASRDAPFGKCFTSTFGFRPALPLAGAQQHFKRFQPPFKVNAVYYWNIRSFWLRHAQLFLQLAGPLAVAIAKDGWGEQSVFFFTLPTFVTCVIFFKTSGQTSVSIGINMMDLDGWEGTT